MEEKDFKDYECYDIETDDDGKRYMHVFCYCWQNDGRTRWDGDPDVEEYDTPYTSTEYTFCRIPLEDLVRCKDADERWSLICDCEGAVQQYEGDYTWEEFIAAGYGDPKDSNGCISTGDNVPAFDNYLHYKDITMDTPDGSYYYTV